MELKTSTSVDIKRANRRSVLRYVLSQNATSRQEVAQALHISMPTVLQNINELAERGLVREVGQYESTGGRKASIIQANADARFCIGVDITKNHIGFVLVDLAGRLRQEARIHCPYANSPDYYRALHQQALAFAADACPQPDHIAFAGVSIPGILSADKNRITDSHALGLRDLDGRAFREQLPWPCTFENDANAAGLAELRDRPADQTMVYLSLSNSVGGAVVMDGRLYPGKNCRSGEFGHMRIVPGGEACYCGQRGCLDAYCSAQRLSDQAADGRLETFFESLQQGDAAAQAVWDVYLEHLATAIISLRMAFDCDIVVGGYVGAFLEEWLPQLRRRVRALDTFDEPCGYLSCCRYKKSASAYGAALQPLEHYLNTI